MDRRKLSKETAIKVGCLYFNEANKEIIDKALNESQDEKELLKKLRISFPKIDTIHEILADGIFPTGDRWGFRFFVGEGVPEELTTTGFLKRWQSRINRSPKRRKELGIRVLDKKCPYCGGRIFVHKRHRWCNGYPVCKYERVLFERNLHRSVKRHLKNEQ